VTTQDRSAARAWRPWWVAMLALTILVAPRTGCIPAAAEEVRIEHLGLGLVGNLEVPGGGDLGQGRVALILHGSLAHHGMEIVASLQNGLKAKGVASLAITLSLGLDSRRGMRDCALEHDHRSADAAGEVATWIDWLEAKGVQRIGLVGHSRGGEQLTRYAAQDPSPRVDRLVLVAPLSDTPDSAAARYRAAHGGDLMQLLTMARKLVGEGEEDTILPAPGFLHCKDAKVTAGTFLDYHDTDEKLSALPLAPTLNLPVLVVAGTADTISPDVAARVTERPAPNVTLAVIDGADHFFRDLFADDLVDQVAAFLAK